MLDLSYTPKPKPKTMSGRQAISMQNVVSNAMATRQGGAVQGNGMTPPKTDGFGRSV